MIGNTRCRETPTADADGRQSSPSDKNPTEGKRRTFLKRTAAGAVTGVGLLSGCLGLMPSESSDNQPAGESDTAETEGGDGNDPKVGVYLGDEAALELWESWFGRPVDYYSFNIPTDGWDGYLVENMPFEKPIASIASERDIAVTMKMFPPSETTLGAVAAGDHADRHRAFARSLIDHGMADATVRIAHEMNGRWGSNSAVGRSDEWVRAWRAVVRAMDTADGAAFDYVWAPHIGRVHMDPTEAYPGDEWVDQIGLTMYDKSQEYYPSECGDACVRERREENWNSLVDRDFGLSYWAEFARDHEKSLAFPEYGVAARNWNGVGGGDNPLFFERFADWIETNDDVVAWHNVWCFVAGPHFVGPSRLHTSDQYGSLPEASETFKTLFGGE